MIAENTYAFLIAVNEYPNDNDMHDLPHAWSNVSKLYEELKSPEIGIPRKNITTITNPDDAKKLLKKLREIGGNEGIKNLIIYYAGHGILDDNGNHYLTLTDSTVENIDIDGLDIADITKALAKNKRLNVFMILDSCFSENAFNEFKARNFLLMASSAKNRTSKYPVDADYSAFTNELIYAIENGIENDQEYLSWRDVYKIMRDNLVEKGFPKPKILIQNEVDELKLVKNLKKAKPLSGNKEKKPSENNFGVDKILDNFKRKRTEGIEKRLEMLKTLLDQYQDKLILEDDPAKRMIVEKQVEKQKGHIVDVENELRELFD